MDTVDRKKNKRKRNPVKKPKISNEKGEYIKRSPRKPKVPELDESSVKSIEKLRKSLKDGKPEEVKKDFVRVVGHFNRAEHNKKYDDKFKAFRDLSQPPSIPAIIGVLPLIVIGLATIGLKHQNLISTIAKGFKEYLNTREQPKSPLDVLTYKQETSKLKIISEVFDKIFEAFKKVDNLEKLVIVSSVATILVDEIPMLIKALSYLPNVSLTAKLNEALSRSLALTRTVQKVNNQN